MSGGDEAELARVLEAAELGDLAPARRWREARGPARSGAARAALWLAGLEAEPPGLEPADETPLGRVAALGLARMRAILELDAEALGRVAAALRALGPASPRVAVELGVTRLWEAVARGAVAEDPREAQALEAQAADLGAASLVIQVASARALAALDAGDLDEAVEVARRASRMAASEGRPQCEYLANVVLARMRRISDHPHFSLRILGALREVVSPPWHRWIDWELVFAGDRAARGQPGPHGVVAALLRAGREGDRARFAEHAEALAEATRGFAPAQRDAHALLFCLDPSRSLDVGSRAFRADAEAWRSGREPLPPSGLQALCLAEQEGDADAAVAFVLADPGRPSRRVLRMALPLLGEDEGRLRLAQSARKRGRVETAAAALLSDAEPLDEAALFRAVYGFAFQEGVHEGVLDVVLHRLRSQLGAHGEVRREGDEVTLRVRRPLLVPDPRCSQTVDDRLLAQLGRGGRATAQQAADTLELPLRTVQRALKRLAAAGLCQRERKGRAVEYRVDDTTFSEPTRF